MRSQNKFCSTHTLKDQGTHNKKARFADKGRSAPRIAGMLAASCLGLLGRSGRGRSDRVKRELKVASTMSTSETELIESTYMVTPTSTGGPAIKPNRESRARLAP
ncbi:jg2804 [Pararge aegeria aegeria]|uniref:Jg2804 protein n=1 Tax=Pararge aegeria aegeria TaxID=348720 RepID=A0A8S4RGH3_9NEOP|nr:jg2804 [Pararge aegeria aegeria]